MSANFLLVQDRYREFMFVTRLWRFLKMFKRAGRCHGITYPNRDSNLLTVPCFTCPWPGVNLPDDWENTPEKLQQVSNISRSWFLADHMPRYIYRLFLGADGNHSLQKKTKPGDDTDYSLVGDHGFFNDPTKLEGFLERISKNSDKPVCADLEQVP